MGFSISTLVWSALGKPPQLVCGEALWRVGVKELHRRTGGKIESGAFLLGVKDSHMRRIKEFIFYDDIDPSCFKNGIVEFNGNLLGEVWEICRKKNFVVVADVHVHPGGYWQSHSDRTNPIIPQTGHLALVLPNFAKGEPMPGRLGVYEYEGNHEWTNHSPKGKKYFYVGWMP